MKLAELFLNRFLYKEPLQNLETKDSVYNSSNLNPAVAVPIASGGAATDIGTGNVPVGGDIGNVSTPAPDIVPIGLSVVATGVTVSTNGNVSAFVTLTWNEIISATFDHYQIRFKKSTYTYYQYIDSKTNTITIDNLSPNVLYNFGISSVNKYGTSSAFSTDISTTTATNSTPPATVTGLTTMAGIQYVIATWTSNTESDIASYNIYRHTANNSALAVLIGNSFTNYFIDGGLTGGTPYYYWIKAVNTSGILSTSFSTVSTATPRNIITSDIGAGQITPPLTNLPAINPVTGYLNENTVGTYELQDNAVYEANVLAGAISATKTNLAAINPVTGDLNLNTVGTSQLQDNAVGSQEGNIALRGWEQTCAFTATDADTVTWGAGTFTSSNGDSYSILTGNTGNMTAKTYIYLNIAVSTTAYQTTTTATTAIGDGKVLIAIAQNNTTEATFMLLNNNSYNIDAANIVAGSITANEIQAGAVIASKITSFNFQISAGTFTNNSPTAGKISWAGVKVVYAGAEYAITDGNCLATDKHIYWQLASPTVFSASATLPALGNEDFLAVFNNGGTAVFVWNSTVINGNRITTGSITATNMAAHTITANEIAAGTITATEIAAGTITANKIKTFNFQLTAGAFANNTPTAGKLSWTGCKVVYDGVEYSIADDDCLATDKHIYWRLAAPTVFSASATLPALGNDDFIVVFNSSGTALYVWNSTIINGNRITTGSITATNMAANTITANEIAAGTITSVEIMAGSISANRLHTYNFMMTEGAFTNDDPAAGRISWANAKVVYDGVEYAITDGSCDSGDKHIYWVYGATTFSHSANLPALANNDFLVAFNDTGTALYVWNSTIVNGNRITTGSITATNIAANTLTANEIAAGTITADRINSNSFAFSAITFTANSPTAGKVAWTGCKVVYKGTEYAITNGSCLATDQHIYWQLSSPNVFSASATLPALGNDDFLVVYNDAGTPKYVWNSTVINGNRISTGSIYTGQIATGTITGTNIAGNTIASSNILSVNADKILIDGAVYLSNWRAGTELTKIDGGNLYVGSQITIGASAPAPLSGHIKSGQTDYNTGVGWWLGSVAGVAKFSIGNPADSYFTYDSGTGVMTLKGAITATTGAIGGWNINATSIYTGTEDHSGYTTNAGDMTLYSNGSDASIHANKFYIDSAGVLNCTSAIVSGAITTGANSSLDAQYISSSNITNTLTMGTAGSAGYIQSYGWNGTVGGYQLKGGTSPSFILIGGTITGSIIQTSASANTGVKMSSAIGGINVYGETLNILATDGTLYGYVGGYAGYMALRAVSGRNMLIGADNATVFFNNDVGTAVACGGLLGSSDAPWNTIYGGNMVSNNYYEAGGNQRLYYSSSKWQSSANFKVNGSVNITGNLVFDNAASITINGTAFYVTADPDAAGKYYLRS